MIIGLYRDDNKLTILNLEYNENHYTPKTSKSSHNHFIKSLSNIDQTTITIYLPDVITTTIQGERVIKLYSTSKFGNAFAWGRLNQNFRYIDNK